MSALDSLPPLLLSFCAALLAAFVLGLELHNYRRSQQNGLGFGTTRTLTLMAMAGFVLFQQAGWDGYFAGLALMGLWLTLDYWRQLKTGQESLLPYLVALLATLLGPLALLAPPWFMALCVVVVLLMLGAQPDIRRFSDTFRTGEAVTLAKFLLMAGLVLPLLPKDRIAAFVPVTWYQVWFAVIVVSGISYAGYLVQTYFLPRGGLLVTGLSGGLYSSTAATVVLARRARELPADDRLIGPAILLATAMMYLRLWALVFILGHHAAAWQLAAPFAVLVLLTLLFAWWQAHRLGPRSGAPPEPPSGHPLEFSTALLFALLFVVFALLTAQVVTRYGSTGLHALAFIVGFTDIDPFVLSLLAGKYAVSESAIVGAVLVASGSNNLLKAAYAVGLARRRNVLPAALWLAATCLASLLYVWWPA